jgi:two-component system sensor histidine kinase VicK
MINYGARKDTLLDMITHNLAGPLNMSKNILDWTKKVVSDSRSFDISAQLELIADSTQQCIEIVNDFLKEEHQESAHTYVRKTRFDILERITATLDKIIELNKDKNFRLITDLNNLNINSDSVKFFQVIHNILSNAIKFTHENGQIDVKVEEGENDFTVSISDDGIGIPDNLKPLIFLQRTPAGRPGLKGEKSTGLGLFIIKQLVEIMDGTIWFESSENKGSTFYIKLPKE